MSLIRGAYTDDEESKPLVPFAEKVQGVLGKRERGLLSRSPKCCFCYKEFGTPFYLKRHIERKHQEVSKRQKLKEDDNFSCRICHFNSDQKEEHFRHIFLLHSDIEVRSKYNCSLEYLLGDYMLKRIRKPIFSRVQKSNNSKTTKAR